MKYLKKFYESKEEDLDKIKDVVTDCFVEFLDSDADAEIYVDGYDDPEWVTCAIPNTDFPDNEEIDLDEFRKYIKNSWNKVEDINVSILRVKDVFPDIEWKFQKSEDGWYYVNFYLEKEKKFDYYTIRNGVVGIDEKKLKEILNLDKDVKLGIWSSGSENTLRIDFKNKEHFDKHMYRDFYGRINELPNSFDNSEVEGALIIFPEYTSTYRKLGEGLKNLKIEEKPLITRITDVNYSGQKESIYRNGRSITEQVWKVSLGLNKDFKSYYLK